VGRHLGEPEDDLGGGQEQRGAPGQHQQVVGEEAVRDQGHAQEPEEEDVDRPGPGVEVRPEAEHQRQGGEQQGELPELPLGPGVGLVAAPLGAHGEVDVEPGGGPEQQPGGDGLDAGQGERLGEPLRREDARPEQQRQAGAGPPQQEAVELDRDRVMPGAQHGSDGVQLILRARGGLLGGGAHGAGPS